MNSAKKSEIEEIIVELNGIISDLRDVSTGVRRDFGNIGNESCAEAIDNVVDKYMQARKAMQLLI